MANASESSIDAARCGAHVAAAAHVGPAPSKPCRSAKDKAVIAGLSVLLVALLCGVAWGVTTIVSMLQTEQRDAQEMASYAVPATPEELRAQAAGEDTESTAWAEPASEQDSTVSTSAVSASEELPSAGASSSSSAETAGQDTGDTAESDTSASASVASDQASATSATSASSSDSSAIDESLLVDNPIDFAQLQKSNTDIYAWLYIPNTGINLPIAQNAFDDSYYLTHNSHREDDPYGAVYTQMANKKDFSDPVTVIYGHDTEGQLKNVHYFEDEKFFQENEKMYVYTTGHIYTYRIISAYKYDNRHILNSFDFTKLDVLQEYFDYILNPDSLLYQVRQGDDVTLDASKDKIIQISTCMLDEFHGSSRYIVTGVLVDDQLTR